MAISSVTHITMLMPHLSTLSRPSARITGRKASGSASSARAADQEQHGGQVGRDQRVAQSMPPKPGMMRRSGRTIQSVTWNTPCDTGLRDGSRVQLHPEARQQRHAEQREDGIKQEQDNFREHRADFRSWRCVECSVIRTDSAIPRPACAREMPRQRAGVMTCGREGALL